MPHEGLLGVGEAYGFVEPRISFFEDGVSQKPRKEVRPLRLNFETTASAREVKCAAGGAGMVTASAGSGLVVPD